VKKRTAGGVWSTLATFTNPGAPVGVILQSGLMIADGTVYLLVFLCDAVDGHGSIRVITISSADVVSGMLLVEDNVTAANQGLNGGNFVGSGDYKGATEIAFPYPANITSFFNAYGDTHVARGDISVTPLAPTWTIDTAVVGSSPTPSYPNPQIGLVYLGNDIHLYWVRTTNPDPSLGIDAKTYRSIKSAGVWGAPALIYTDVRGANGQLNIIKYNNQVGVFLSVQGFGPLFQGSSSICPAIEVDLTFNLALALNPSAPPPPGGPPPQPGVVPRKCIPQS